MTNRGADMKEYSVSPFKKVLASMCHHCPLCRYGRAKPDSVLGKVLHHRLHAEYCPMWKAEKEAYGAGQQTPGE